MSQRVVQVDLSSELLTSLLTVGDQANTLVGVRVERGLHCVEGLPEGSRLVAVRMARGGASVELLFAHDSFEEVPDDQPAPRLVCRYERPEPRPLS